MSEAEDAVARRERDDHHETIGQNTFELLYKHNDCGPFGSDRVKMIEAQYIQGVGCLVRVNGEDNKLTFVPGAKIVPDVNNGKKLVKDA